MVMALLVAVAATTGTKLEGLFQLPQQAERVCLEIYLYHSRGSFEVRNLALREAEAELVLSTPCGVCCCWLGW